MTRPLLILLLLAAAPIAAADSALDLLSGFDTARIEACYPASDERASGELAKLLYRLRKADEGALNEKAAASDAAAVGDAVVVEGRVQTIRQLVVPASLVEFLELRSFRKSPSKPLSLLPLSQPRLTR